MRALYAVAVLVAPTMIGCASDGAVERELSRVRREMHGLKKEVQSQRLELERLEGRVTLLSLGGESPRAEPTAPAPIAQAGRATQSTATRRAKRNTAVRPQRGPSRVLPVVRMSAQADPTAEPVTSFDDPGAQDDGSPPVLIKLGPAPSPKGDRLPVDHEVLKRPDPNVKRRAARADKPEPKPKRKAKKSRATRAQIRKAYDAALATLRDDKNPAGALEQFEVFLEAHPTSRLADNALYWSGECHRTLGQYEAAATVFARLLRSHPRSAKVAYAKVGLGVSRIELGERKKGEALLREVIAKAPSSGAAQEANSYLASHGGK